MRKPGADITRRALLAWHVAILAVVFGVWYALTTPGIVDEAYANRIAFFFGRPLQVVKVVIEWFVSGKIYPHRAITLWVLRKDERVARAIIRIYPHGRELVTMLNDDLVFSRLYRDDEDNSALADMAEGARVAFVAKGWVQDPEPETPPSA